MVGLVGNKPEGPLLWKIISGLSSILLVLWVLFSPFQEHHRVWYGAMVP